MTVLLCAGPPLLSNLGSPAALGGKDDVVFPIGMTQNLSINQNKSWTRIFEIGSDRSVWIPGRTVQQMSLSRVYYNGPSLLRLLYAYYRDLDGQFPNVEALWDHNLTNLEFPYVEGAAEGGLPKRKKGLHDVKIPPGFGNIFLNLASDMFNSPIGLLLLLRSAEEQNLGAFYLEQCVVPTHGWGIDAQGLIHQESVALQFERLVPLQMNAIATLRGLQPANNPTDLTQLTQASL